MKLTANPAWLSLPPNRGKGSGAKFLRIMKLTTILILAACLHTSAKGVAQQTITFSGKEVSLENVFNAIKKQTNYRFFFNTDMLQNASKVTLEVKNAQIEQVMNMALKDQPLTFTIKGRTIFIMKKPEEEKKSVQMAPTGDPITVSGKVTDENGEPLAGANVKVKGGNNGITTDNQGRFTLANVDPNATLEVSFVGRETQMLSVRGKTVFSVALGQKVGELDETVVIAYGTTTKRFNTGNISSIKASDIEKQPVNNPLLALQGRVPGLFITQANGLPGSGITVRIQGQNSIEYGKDPLYVIDGVPYVSQMLPTVSGGIGNILGTSGAGANGGGRGNPLTYINPQDIESIEILKDADATAIYGSRAANGAILITTKKGKSGATKIETSLQQGWGKVTTKLDLLNTRQYLDMRYEALKNDGIDLSTLDENSNYDLTVWDTTRFTDWQKKLIGGTAHYTNISSNVSGGTSSIQYTVGGTYQRTTTVFPGDFSDQKGGIHFNLSTSSTNQKLRLQITGNYVVNKNELPYTDLTNTAVTLPPNAPELYKSDGTLNWAQNSSGTSTWVNPLTVQSATYENKTKNLISNLNLAYTIVPGLEVKGNFGYNNLQTNEYSAFPLTYNAPEKRPLSNRSAYYTLNNVNSWTIEPMLNYKKAISRSKIEAIVGATVYQSNGDGTSLNGLGYNSDDVLKDMRSAATLRTSSSINYVYKYNGFFGRVTYNMDEKYLVNLTGRRDGSSSFGSKNQFHNFWGVGAGWIFSKESFTKNFSFLSFGKIRASYGTTGNDQIGYYRFMNLYNATTAGVPYQGATGLAPRELPNPYLQWEETSKLQFGLDLGFFKDKLLLTANYVSNRSSNQLLSYDLPIITGYFSVTDNFPATVANTSWEFSLDSRDIKLGNVSWSPYVNLTIPKNKLIEFSNLSTSSYKDKLVIGQPVSIQKVYHFIGVDEVTGKYQVADADGNPTGSPNSVTDKTVLINTLPKFYGGVGNSFRFKQFQLDFLFQFVKQKGLSNFSFSNNSFPGDMLINQPVTVLKRWQKPGDVTRIQRYNTDYSLILEWINMLESDAVYTDASYIRLTNFSLSYQLPERLTRSALRNCKIFLHGQNLFTITNYIGLDPEVQNGLPPLRIITAGVRFEL